MQGKSSKGPSFTKQLTHLLLNTKNSSGQKPLPAKLAAQIKRKVK